MRRGARRRRRRGLVLARAARRCLAVQRPLRSRRTTHLLVVVGLAGTPEHGELFKKWGTTLADTASEKLGVDKANVTLLADAAATKDGGDEGARRDGGRRPARRTRW